MASLSRVLLFSLLMERKLGVEVLGFVQVRRGACDAGNKERFVAGRFRAKSSFLPSMTGVGEAGVGGAVVEERGWIRTWRQVVV